MSEISETDEARVRRYADAVRNLLKMFPIAKHPWEPQLGANEFDIARAVLAVDCQEHDELRAENAALRAEVEHWRKTAEHYSHTVIPKWQTRAEAAEAELADTRQRLRQAEERLAAVHEIGHCLGLAHTTDLTVPSVMGNILDQLGGWRRDLHAAVAEAIGYPNV